MMEEFREFVARGNVVDMAVGIVIGAAFGKIVSSFVGDILMPPIGALLGGVDFSNLAITIKHATDTSPSVVIGYGRFIQTLVDFLIIAFALFFVVKTMNTLKKKQEEKPSTLPEPSNEEVLLAEIRDLLKPKS